MSGLGKRLGVDRGWSPCTLHRDCQVHHSKVSEASPQQDHGQPPAWSRNWALARSAGSLKMSWLPLFGRAPLLLAIAVIFIKKVTQCCPALCSGKRAFVFALENEIQS